MLNVGALPAEVEGYEHDAVAADLLARFRCVPVYLGAALRERYYRGFCKQALIRFPPLFSPTPFLPLVVGLPAGACSRALKEDARDAEKLPC